MMPVYDKPMIYYPLSILMLAGITEIPTYRSPLMTYPLLKKLLGDGSDIGRKFAYAEQAVPNGLAQAFAEEFIGGDNVSFSFEGRYFFTQVD
jgi:glucose-1-phosphate thymidylyltransferase